MTMDMTRFYREEDLFPREFTVFKVSMTCLLWTQEMYCLSARRDEREIFVSSLTMLE